MGRSHTEEEVVRAVSFEPESHVPSVLVVDDFASADTVSLSASNIYPLQRLRYVQVLSNVTRSSSTLVRNLLYVNTVDVYPPQRLSS